MINYYSKKINDAHIYESPYPHLIIDNIIDTTLFREVNITWPSQNFHNDLRGSNCFYFSSELKNTQEKIKLFWENFIYNHITPIANLLVTKMYDFIKYKKVSDKIEWGTGYTQENFNKSEPLDFSPHTHFDHDPLWVLTFLIYVNDAFNNSPGTSLCSIGDTKSERIENFLQWNKIWQDDKIEYLDKIELTKNIEIKKVKTVDFISNRLFCFVDGPFSFHSVNYLNSDQITNRKSLRFALGFERNNINLQYNISAENWLSLFNNNEEEKIENILDKEHDNFFNSNHKSLSNNDWYIDKFPFF